MFKIPVYESDVESDLSARAGMPVCMLLRANGVLSAAWLKTKGEADVPDSFDCERSPSPCPRAAAVARIPERIGYIVEKGDTYSSLAAQFHLPERLVRVCIGENGLFEGNGIVLPLRRADMREHIVSPGEKWMNIDSSDHAMLLNGHFAPLYPGMKILI